MAATQGRPIASSAAGASKATGCAAELTIPLPTYTAGPAQGGPRPVNVQITEPIPTGTDAIREALRVRRKTNLVALARDHGLSAVARDAFIDGRRSLPAETLWAIAKDLWPHLEFDAQADRLRPAVREPAKPQGVLPVFSITPPVYRAGPAQQAGPQPVKEPRAMRNRKPDRGGSAAGAKQNCAQLDQRTALPDQCLPSAEADVRPPRRKSGFDAAISMKSGLFETLQHMVVRCLRAELRGEPLSV